MTILDDRHPPHRVLPHAPHCGVRIIIGGDGDQVGTADLTHRRDRRIADVRNDSHHDVAIGYQALQLPVVDDEHTADAVLAHHPRRLGDGLAGPQRYGGWSHDHADFLSHQEYLLLLAPPSSWRRGSPPTCTHPLPRD